MDTPPAELPLKKIRELEAGDANLEEDEEEMEKLIVCGPGSGIRNDCGPSNQMSESHSSYPVQRTRLSSPTGKGGPGGQDGTLITCSSSFTARDDSIFDLPSALLQSAICKNKQYLNILQSMEMLGRSSLGPIIEECDFTEAKEIIRRSASGECWTGQFPVRNKQGRRFHIIATHTPLYDDFGILVGVVCLGYDSQPFLEISPFSAGINLSPEAAYPSYIGIGSPKIGPTTTTGLLAPQQKTLKDAIASNLTDLTLRIIKKVRAMTTCEKRETQGVDTVGSDEREDSPEERSRGKQSGISEMITSAGKGISSLWKGSEQNGSLTSTTPSHRVPFSLNHEPEVDIVQSKSFQSSQNHAVESDRT
ncbi:uncharacterized protein LOC113334578 [Papaver somniferum]|uniref:uncharacterized protein LOC113334578 n=1 Tax=Papaver somniferum TaxID=3469 RepID=UPI000E705366|nr:uncharacterized protein LOC113334578 [Papaver somniferum]